MKEELERLIYDDKGMAPYTVGALMYCPANNETVADGIVSGKFGKQYSLTLCLEDSISDSAVETAEYSLEQTIKTLHQQKQEREFYVPKLFVRVREPEQISKVCAFLSKFKGVIDGFVLPKLSACNAKKYIKEVKHASEKAGRLLYMMPTLESADLVSLKSRYDTMYAIKNELDQAKEYVLNVRVGGNDFCKGFGVRRHIDETIYDIGPVANILYDILTCFSMDYVVSGPVWEYFGSEDGQWKTGLERELRLDKLNGFIGKTAIHPNQIEIVNHGLKVDEEDLRDALSIMELSENELVLVEKSASGERMNEYKTHLIWAEKILRLAKIYGVKEKWSKR